ncbi:hypothetical protein SAMN02745146_1493 [Hymenobacter daecheongensis DSM 21074]|uniref:Uncharacterized protein n=1 Tax=Hymenobacter daecheongensis DSM 21074 TaxID=1121955 RepID=A0A1M6DFZ9_9BACT|nr:hypothetical protein [Hymenobacter daecheongensis]SHI72043.1 hypothetical protein SAMN02745146_1493 [Hymenobacter daecheongensis DSM 21074]
MKTVLFRPLALALLLGCASLSACNTGTGSGDTNVERGADKTKDPDPGQRASSNTSGLPTDTTRTTTGKDLYDNAATAKDRNNDGLAD